MTKREMEIYKLIKNQPSITQNEIADILKMTRTSVAVHITHIVQKGYILGRQYVLRKDPKVLVIGAANVDIQGFCNKKVKLHDSNVGNVSINFGGVGRNIAVNIRKLLDNVEFITIIDKGVYGCKIMEDLTLKKLDIKNIHKVNGNMSVYLSVLDENGDMLVGVSDMKIADYITVDFLKERKESIESAEIIILDTNIPKESIEYVVSLKNKNQKLIIDTVSFKKAAKISNILDKIDILKTNKLELEALLNKPLKGKKDLKNGAIEILEKGVKEIYLTLGADGLIAMNEHKKIKLSNPNNVEVVSVTGAGDIFVSALAYAISQDYSIEKSAKFAQCASIFKIAQNSTTPEDFSVDKVDELIEKYYKDNEGE